MVTLPGISFLCLSLVPDPQCQADIDKIVKQVQSGYLSGQLRIPACSILMKIAFSSLSLNDLIKSFIVLGSRRTYYLIFTEFN